MSLPPNFIARPYRGVSVQRWEGSLDSAELSATLLGREAYRRTEFLVLRQASRTALLQLRRASDEELFSPIVDVHLVAGPDECTYVVSADTDTANATALARVASRHGGALRAYVVEGRYHHVNFIFDPRPVHIRVADVVPPEPPKLLEMVQRVVEFDEDLPPIDLVFEPIDVRAIARATRAPRYLLPCRGSGIDLPAPVAFLDERPADGDGVLIGCERSAQFYRWFYRREPDRADLCPRALTVPDGPTVIKCCFLERGTERDGSMVVVPWGASLSEVQDALHVLVAGSITTTDVPSMDAARARRTGSE